MHLIIILTRQYSYVIESTKMYCLGVNKHKRKWIIINPAVTCTTIVDI